MPLPADPILAQKEIDRRLGVLERTQTSVGGVGGGATSRYYEEWQTNSPAIASGLNGAFTVTTQNLLEGPYPSCFSGQTWTCPDDNVYTFIMNTLVSNVTPPNTARITWLICTNVTTGGTIYWRESRDNYISGLIRSQSAPIRMTKGTVVYFVIFNGTSGPITFSTSFIAVTTGSGVKGDTGDTGATGATGAQGPPGIPGTGAAYMQRLSAPAINTPYTINHNLNSLVPLVQLWDYTTGSLMQSEVAVIDANNVRVTFNVQPTNDVNVVVAAGIPATTPNLSYRHVQSTAATTWTINHNLGFRPNVAVVDSTGNVIYPGNIQYTSSTQVVLTFSAAVGGEAYLS